MEFIGKVCPYCKTEFKEDDDVVVCSICEMPHHKDCWVENKACTTFGCTGTIKGAEQASAVPEHNHFCMNCGASLKEGQRFCVSCGTQVGTSGKPHFQVAGSYNTSQNYQQSSYGFSQQQYSPQYAGMQQNIGNNMYGPQQQQVDQDLSMFLQSNQMVYVSKFQKMQILNTKTSWNWASFFFGAYWYAYRKMYGIAAAYIGISFVARFIPGINFLITLALWVCSGIFGNYFYKQYIDEELRVAKCMDTYNKNTYIAKKGGTSIGAIFAIIGITCVISMVITSL